MGAIQAKLAEMRGDRIADAWVDPNAVQPSGMRDNRLVVGVIHGTLASKSNSRRMNMRGAHPRVIQEKAAVDFVESVVTAARAGRYTQVLTAPPIPSSLCLSISATVYQDSLRRDLDIELLCDALQKAGVIENDRAFWRKEATRRVSKHRPRVEFEIRVIARPPDEREEAGGLFDSRRKP